MNLREQKERLRREIKGQRAEFASSYCQRADRAIFKYITELPEYQRAERILCFVSTEQEVHTFSVIEHALEQGKVVGVPRCTGKGIMEVCRIDGLEGLETGAYGILEPVRGAPVLLPEELGFAVVPCLSCSSTGRRLGYGGGYYDRYLLKTKAFKAVVCRAGSMREDIPVEAHDLRMDIVVSELGVWRV